MIAVRDGVYGSTVGGWPGFLFRGGARGEGDDRNDDHEDEATAQRERLNCGGDAHGAVLDGWRADVEVFRCRRMERAKIDGRGSRFTHSWFPRDERVRLDASRKLVMIESMPATASIDSARAAALFHALADEIRLDVVELLLHGERCVCDLMAALDLAQSRLSWHLKTLSDAGIITGRKEGRWVYYSLNEDAIAEARAILGSLKVGARRAAPRAVCCD
jgi:ArsR family transcriptional regulator, arsenate/arsenite/antimonite-responsive transcriptional repressor